MYLTNHVRLALGLEGTPDPSLAVVQAAVTKSGYTGYVAMEYTAPAKGGGTHGGGAPGGSPGPSGSAGGTDPVKSARRK